MASLVGITICRTDGMSDYLVNGQTVINGPKTEPDHNGRAYQKVGPNDAKEYDWRKKLGTALMNHLREFEPDTIPDGNGKEYILNEMPEGYSLWVHSASSQISGPQKKKARTDAYLYGHPSGQTKRFRSAEEFKPHLIWLATDSTGDSQNCACKVCKRKDVPLARSTETEAPAPKLASTPVQSDINPTRGQLLDSGAGMALAHPRREIAPTREQLLDADPNMPYLYRLGELAWFNKGATWGLAVICERQMHNSIPVYQLQPLSHPFQHPSPVVRRQQGLRPWLAWTVPNPPHVQFKNVKYDSAPWERILNGDFGPGETDVTGSILAAKGINNTYTPILPLGRLSTSPNDMLYAGMFLGAEKIWVGDAVRLKTPQPEVAVMVIEAILENITATASTACSTVVIGNIYSFWQIPLPSLYYSRRNWPAPRLPQRMAADVIWQNENSLAKNSYTWSEWRLKESRVQRELSDIRGRWYESRLLLPIMRPEEFEKEVAAGKTYEAGIWMNSTFDIGNGVLSKKSRLEAFGRAVPKDFKVSLGLDKFSSDGELLDNELNIPLDKIMECDSEAQSWNIDPELGDQESYGNTMQHQV